MKNWIKSFKNWIGKKVNQANNWIILKRNQVITKYHTTDWQKVYRKGSRVLIVLLFLYYVKTFDFLIIVPLTLIIIIYLLNELLIAYRKNNQE